MRPVFHLLDKPLINQITNEALMLLEDPGVRVHNEEAQNLLAEAGSKVDFNKQVAYIPEELVEKALKIF